MMEQNLEKYRHSTIDITSEKHSIHDRKRKDRLWEALPYDWKS